MSPRHDRPSSGRSFRPFITVVAFITIGWLVWLGSDAPRKWKNPRAAEVATSATRVIEAIKSYRSSHEGKVPDTQLALIDFMRNEWAGEVLPPDPWGHPLVYVPRDSKFHSTYVKSLGADGREDGPERDMGARGRENELDENVDVSVWVCDPPE